MKKQLLGFYNYTVLLTYAGLMFSLYGIASALDKDFWTSAMMLLGAGICDMFDGPIARTKEDRSEHEKRFGIQIDSLCDLVGFGILPGFFVYAISGKNGYVGILCAAYVLAALIRLAYFNILEEDRQKATTEKRDSYLGVPVTTVAIVLPGLYYLYDMYVLKSRMFLYFALAVLAAGFVSPIHVKKPKLLGKIMLLLVGILEILGLVFFMGWDAV